MRIELAGTGKNARLKVEDNGIGMDPAVARKGGFGLTLVQGLATQINGTAALESRPGLTTWTIEFPAG
jgi:two-component sensor histidine kinase